MRKNCSLVELFGMDRDYISCEKAGIEECYAYALEASAYELAA